VYVHLGKYHVPDEVYGFLVCVYVIMQIYILFKCLWYTKELVYQMTGVYGHLHNVYSGDTAHFGASQTVVGYDGKTYEHLQKYRISAFDHTYSFRKLGFNAYVEVEIDLNLLRTVMRVRCAVTCNADTVRLLYDEVVRQNQLLKEDEQQKNELVLHNTAVAAYQQLCLKRLNERLATGLAGKVYSYISPMEL
jgi:hypothetical protein